jgi:hypothetical protein
VPKTVVNIKNGHIWRRTVPAVSSADASALATLI